MVRDRNKAPLEDTPHIQEEPKTVRYVDVTSTKSDLGGIAGILEVAFRKNRSFAFICAMIPSLTASILSLGIALMPGYFIVTKTIFSTMGSNSLLQAFLICTSIALSYICYGITLILVVPVFNKLIPLKTRSWRGNWYSIQTVPWYYHNSLTQLVRYTFLDLVTPSPLNILFYKLMGMKIGKGCVINTSNISDPCLIELEDNVTIGGSATIFGHYAQGGYLVLSTTLIKKGATVGLKASIMGDVIVGEKVTVKPHSVLLPKTRLNKGDPQ